MHSPRVAFLDPMSVRDELGLAGKHVRCVEEWDGVTRVNEVRLVLATWEVPNGIMFITVTPKGQIARWIHNAATGKKSKCRTYLVEHPVTDGPYRG